MKLKRMLAALCVAAMLAGAAVVALYRTEGPQLEFDSRLELTGMVQDEPRELMIQIRNRGFEARRVTGARAF